MLWTDLLTLQTWLERSGFKDLFVTLLIQMWRRRVHAPCPAGRRHPCPGLPVALAWSPVEYLGPAAHLQNHDRHISHVHHPVGECVSHQAAKCWVQWIQTRKLSIPKSLLLLPSSLLLCLMSLGRDMWPHNFSFIQSSSSYSQNGRWRYSGDESQNCICSQTLLSIFGCKDTAWIFFLGLHVLREHGWNIEKVSLYVLLTTILWDFKSVFEDSTMNPVSVETFSLSRLCGQLQKKKEIQFAFFRQNVLCFTSLSAGCTLVMCFHIFSLSLVALVYVCTNCVLSFYSFCLLKAKSMNVSAPGPVQSMMRPQKYQGQRNSLKPPPPPERRSSAISVSPILPSKVKRDSGIYLTDPDSFPAPPPTLSSDFLPPPPTLNSDFPPPPPSDFCEPPPDFVPPPPPTSSSGNGDLPLPPPPPPLSSKPPPLTKKPVPLPSKRIENLGQDGDPRSAGPPPIGGGGRQADFMSDLMKALEKKRGSSSWALRAGGLQAIAGFVRHHGRSCWIRLLQQEFSFRVPLRGLKK